MSAPGLPDFSEPPIVEAVLGIELSPLHGWSIPHYGLLWAAVRERYPSFEVHPALPPAFGSEGPAVRRLLLQVTSVPPVRCWFVDGAGRHLMQIQNDRLIHNWRKQSERDLYPRYESLRESFREDWRALSSFCEQYGLGTLQARSCEVTYVNRIPRSHGWDCAEDIPTLFPAWSGSLISGAPISVALDLRYALKGIHGELRVHLEPVNTADGWDSLQLSLTAQGRPGEATEPGILDWLDGARAQLVQGFADFTSQKMHALWGRKDGQ